MNGTGNPLSGRSPDSRRTSAWVALGLGLLVVLAHFGLLLRWDRVLMVRDLPFLHLPLRETFAALAREAWPAWNPTIHAGQPILSNPHYAAWYPPTWLALLLAPRIALHAEVLLHAAWAFAGAWYLARRLGGRLSTAAFAAVAWAGSSFFVALTNTLLIFFGLSWTPWVLALALARPGEKEGDTWASRVVAASPAALALGLQMLSGDPAAVIITAFLLALLAFERPVPTAIGTRPEAPTRAGMPRSRGAHVLLITALAVGLAAVQILPTALRLAETRRAEGLDFAAATSWSTRPGRFVESIFPTFHGDATRDEENLFFGWTLHDKRYPFLLSIYPGLLVLLLGLRGLLRRDLPWKRMLRAATLVGIALALGRHNPLFEPLWRWLPGFSWFRYPEKYLMLSLVALWLAAVFEWERQSVAGDRPDHTTRAFAGAAVLLATTRLIWLYAAPGAVAASMAAGAGMQLSPAVEATGLQYLRDEALLACGLALLTGLLLWLRRGRFETAATMALIALVAADGWVYGQRANPTLPLDEFQAPPAAAVAASFALPAQRPSGIGGPHGRLFSDMAFYAGPQVGLRIGRLGFYQIRARLERLEPYSGALWGLRYALHEDYDLMLTSWGRHALDGLHRSWPQPALRQPLLAAWNVSAVARVRWPQELRDDLARGEPSPAPVRVEPHPSTPRLRLPAAVHFHPDRASAWTAAVGDEFDVVEHEHLIGSPPADWHPDTAAGTPAVRGVEETTNRLRIRLQAPRDAVLVVADTFDVGWEATADGRETTILPTALGQMAIPVPAGTAVVEIAYRDPAVAAGAALTGSSLLFAALAWLRHRRREAEHVERPAGKEPLVVA